MTAPDLPSGLTHAEALRVLHTDEFAMGTTKWKRRVPYLYLLLGIVMLAGGLSLALSGSPTSSWLNVVAGVGWLLVAGVGLLTTRRLRARALRVTKLVPITVVGSRYDDRGHIRDDAGRTWEVPWGGGFLVPHVGDQLWADPPQEDQSLLIVSTKDGGEPTVIVSARKVRRVADSAR